MHDEPNPDDMRDLWRNQSVQPLRMTADELRRKAEALEAKVRWTFRAAVAVLIFVSAGYGSFLYFFPDTVHRVGSVLALTGFLFGARQLWQRGPARTVPSGPVQATCAAYRAELVRQRDFHRDAWMRIACFVPGPVVFIMGFVAGKDDPARALALAAALVAAPFAAGIPLNRRQSLRYQREIEDLDALTRLS